MSTRAADAKVSRTMPLGSQRFLFVTGKGGTGKTTVSAAVARARARRGDRVLLVSSGESERLSHVLGAAPLGSEIRRLETSISAVHVDAELAWQEYGELILRSRRLQSAVFGNRYTKQFLRGIPGLSEWAVLGKAWYHTTERDESGRLRFDVVIVDAPATGHGLEMLRVPKVIVDLAAPGILRRDAERAWAALSDAAYTGVIVVTLAEEMPVVETGELVDGLRRELGLPIALLVKNRVLPALFEESERRALVQGPPFEAETRGDYAVAAARAQAFREKAQAECLEELAQLGLPSRELPWVASLDRQALDGFADLVS